MSDKKDLLVLLKAESPRTASDLAKALDVTSRTIYRWVEKLQEEGQPIYSTTGRSGGIGLDLDGSIIASLEAAKSVPDTKSSGAVDMAEEDDFSIETPKLHFLSEEKKTKKAKSKKTEKAPAASKVTVEEELKTKETVPSESSSSSAVSDRLSDEGPVFADWVEIDFTDEEIEFKIDKKYVICKEAIFTRHVLNFTYHLPQGKMLICSTEPVKFFLHDGQWHVLAWVRQVEKFKVFQLLNMTELQIGPEKHNRTADFSIQQVMKK